MEISVNNKDIVWSYAARIFQLASSVLLLPFILRMVSSEELAIWYIFIAISTFVLLLDFGFSPTILRNVTYVFSGAKVLQKEGLSDTSPDGYIDYRLLKSLIGGVKKIYRILSFVAGVLMLTAGTWYIYSISSGMGDSQEYVIIWLFYIASTCLSLYFLYFYPLIMGCGKQRKQYQIIVVSRITNLLITLAGVLSGYGLAALVLGTLISTLINRLLSYRVFYSKDIREKLSLYASYEYNVFTIIWKNSYRFGLVSIANYLILNGSLFIVTSFSDLQMVAMYGLTSQIIATLVSVSQILFGTYIPTFNSLRLRGENELLKEKLSLTMVISLLLFIMGSICLLLWGNGVLKLLESSTYLLPNKYLFFMLLTNLLYFNHNNCASVISTDNTTPYAYPMLISGVLIILLSIILYKYTALGLWSVILSQGVVQLAYNNWKWPYSLKKLLGFSYMRLLYGGVVQIVSPVFNRTKK